VAKRILASPNKFYYSFGEIEHGSILAAVRAADSGDEGVNLLVSYR
jgi:hypothetical protein